MKRIYPISTAALFYLLVYSYSHAACESLLLEGARPALRLEHRSTAYPSIYAAGLEHKNIDVLIDKVLRLQQSLLINRLRDDEITKEHIARGFLVSESSAESVKHDLERFNGKLILVCGPLGDAQDELLGYAILTNVADLVEATESKNGIFAPSIPVEEWQAFLSNGAHGYIHQIAVHPDMRGKGVGTALIEACKTYSPAGVAADILFAPEPYVNEASYRLFLKRGFQDVGTLDIVNFPSFKRCQTHMVVWKGL